MKKTTLKETLTAIEDLDMDYLFTGCSILRERGVILQNPDTDECVSVIPHMEELCELEDLGMNEHDSLEHLMYLMVYQPLTRHDKKSVAWKVFCQCYDDAVAKDVECPPFQAFVDTMNSALAEIICNLMATRKDSHEAVN